MLRSQHYDVAMPMSCSIQQSAALALGRLANYSDDLAEAVVQNEILPQLVGVCLGYSTSAHVHVDYSHNRAAAQIR